MGELALQSRPQERRAPTPVSRSAAHNYWIVPTEPKHLHALAATMRPADRAEIQSVGVSVKRALWRGYRNSIRCRAVLVDGEVAAVWGLCLNLHNGVSLLSGLGVPWLHTAPAIEQIAFAFVRQGKAEVAAMTAICPKLENHVAADYAAAIRFLGVLGFTVDPPAHSGAPFRRFHKGF